MCIRDSISDQATVEYLDDKLGHPLTDPHGSEIPEDTTYLDANAEVLVSMLREGHTVKIVGINKGATKLGLVKDEVVTVGPRVKNDEVWTLVRKNGDSIELDHDQADSVTVVRAL